VQILVKLSLPRDTASVSITRRVVRSALVALGVVEDIRCTIDVVDSGRGYDEQQLQSAMPHPSAEQGRGLHLIRMLAENVQLAHHPKHGTIMHFEKKLVWEPQSVVQRLA